MVTVDTEADDAWSRPNKLELTNIRQLSRFQDLCDEYRVVPTYLVTYECATRDEALSTLKLLADSRQCEIGHHLHVWSTPPFHNGGANGIDHRWMHAYQFQLPHSLFIEKAECLRSSIETSFGQSPTSHRAGRWGVDQRTVDWLGAAGFIVDTSIRTGLPLTQRDLGNWNADASAQPIACLTYEMRKNPYIWARVGRNHTNNEIVEIPATVSIPDGMVSWIYRNLLVPGRPFESHLLRLVRKLGGRRMLRPNPNYPPGELQRIMDQAIRQGITAVNLMLHSSELALHCSPFSGTREDVNSVWAQLEEAFQFVSSREIESACASDVGQLARSCA